MINEIGNPPQYPDLFNDNFEENLKKLSADQIRDLDLNAMQDFGKQKEMEYKKDYEEFRGYYDRWSQDLTQHKRSLEESQKKLINKIIEMENKYGLYIYGRDQWEKIPKDFKNTWILASDTIHKQYEFIRKTEHTSEDINSLWAENMQVIFSPFGFGLSEAPQIGEGWKGIKLQDILNNMKGKIDEDLVSEWLRHKTKSGVYAGNIKIAYVRWFVGLRYLLTAAQKHNDAENIRMIEATIEYVLDGIKKLDAIIKKSPSETSQEILDTIR